MDDSPIEIHRGEFTISTDRKRIDLDSATRLLHSTHWAAELSRDTLRRAIANSISFGVYQAAELIGFGRIVTDLATYAYWTDVVIAEPMRGRGLGRWLSQSMLDHPDLQDVRRVVLLTRDAAEMYTALGFREGPGSLIYMEHRPGKVA
jgi:N-acetylglutamate synthase-like GNAT family acetyltransferase